MGKEGGEDALDNGVVTDNDLADFSAQGGVGVAEGFDSLLCFHVLAS